MDAKIDEGQPGAPQTKTPLQVNKLKYYRDEKQDAKTHEEFCKLREEIESELQGSGDKFLAKPFPSVSFLQKLSKAAYEPNFKIKKPWLQLKNIYCSNNEMKARIFINTIDRQLVVVFKGTNVTSAGDLKTDLNSVFLGRRANSHCNSAATVGAKARLILEQFHGRVHLIITGHSLGGYLAQLAAFAAKNLCIVDGKFQVVDPESCIDIYPHTVVFDSPAAAERIMQSTFNNPINSTEILRLDVTNYIKSANMVNYFSETTRHLGEVIFVKDDDSHLLQYRYFLKMKHGIDHFDTIEWAKKLRVTDLCNLTTEPLDQSAIPSMTFSKSEFEALQVLPLLKTIHLNISKLINFNISNDYVRVFNEKADSFVPRMRLFLLENRKLLNDHVQQIEGFQLLIASEFWKILYADFQDLNISLEHEYAQVLLNIRSDVHILCNKPLRENILLAQIIRNSIPNTYFLRYKHYKDLGNEIVQLFLSNFKGSLILIMDDDDKFEEHDREITKTCKFITISNNSETSDNKLKMLENVRVDIVSKDSKCLIENKPVNFFGSTVRIKDLCKVLPNDTNLIEIIDFALSHCDDDSASPGSQFYVTQRLFIVTNEESYIIKCLTSSDELFSALAEEKSSIILSAGPGMGKTTVFSHLKTKLTKTLPNHWIVKINLLEQSQYLNSLLEPPVRINIKHAHDFIMQSQTGRTAFQMHVLEYLIRTKRVVVLIDAFDEICPLYRKITLQIIARLKMSQIQFAVSTRPQELEQIQKKLKSKVHFELLEIADLGDFFRQYFVLKENLDANEAQSKADNLVQFSNDTFELGIFWKIPLHALMVAELYAKSTRSINMNNLAGLFELFVEKRIGRDLEEKMNLDPSHPKQHRDFEKKKKSILESLMKLALREIFTEYKDPNVVRLATIRKRHERDINYTGIATIKSTKVHFSHYTFAEYLSIKFCILNLQDNRVLEVMKQVLLKSTHYMLRKFLNAMVTNLILPSSFKDLVTEHSDKILVRICKDNLLEVHRLLRRSDISFVYNEVQRVGHSQESMWDEFELTRPSKRARGNNDDDDSDFYEDDDENDFGHFKTLPLTLAIMHASENLVLELIADGANLSEVLKNPISNYEDILSHAIKRNMPSVVKEIFEIRPLKNEPNYEKLCIIHWAIRANNLTLLQLLFKAGASICALDEHDRAPLQIANTMAIPNQQIIQFLHENLVANHVAIDN